MTVFENLKSEFSDLKSLEGSSLSGMLGIAVLAMIDYSIRLSNADERINDFIRSVFYFALIIHIIQNDLVKIPRYLSSFIGLMVCLCAGLSFINPEVEGISNILFLTKYILLSIVLCIRWTLY